MATVTTDNQYYTNIANAIREKNGGQTQYLPGEMAAAILSLPAAEEFVWKSGSFTSSSATTSRSVSTGLSKITVFLVVRNSSTILNTVASMTGTLMMAFYTPSKKMRVTTSNGGVYAGTSSSTVSGGTFTVKETTNGSYLWYAYGKE